VTPPVIRPAFAKVNLFLDTLEKRPDGYHTLKTLFERIDLADEVALRPIPGSQIRCRCSDPALPADRSNLAVRAAEGYQALLGKPLGVEITLTKRIPMAAGLGGGSSDAAAVLAGLQEMTGGGVDPKALLDLARTLGADVPFFLADVPFAWGEGRGDKIAPADFSVRLRHLLVQPDFPIPTAAVYRGHVLTPFHPDARLLSEAVKTGRVERIRPHLYNALEPSVERLFPAVAGVKRALEEAGLKRPMVSGSGSTVFALCDGREPAAGAMERLSKQHPTWRVWTSQTSGSIPSKPGGRGAA